MSVESSKSRWILAGLPLPTCLDWRLEKKNFATIRTYFVHPSRSCERSRNELELRIHISSIPTSSRRRKQEKTDLPALPPVGPPRLSRYRHVSRLPGTLIPKLKYIRGQRYVSDDPPPPAEAGHQSGSAVPFVPYRPRPPEKDAVGFFPLGLSNPPASPPLLAIQEGTIPARARDSRALLFPPIEPRKRGRQRRKNCPVLASPTDTQATRVPLHLSLASCLLSIPQVPGYCPLCRCVATPSLGLKRRFRGEPGCILPLCQRPSDP